MVLLLIKNMLEAQESHSTVTDSGLRRKIAAGHLEDAHFNNSFHLAKYLHFNPSENLIKENLFQLLRRLKKT